MKFGNVPDAALSSIPLALPPDPIFNGKVLNGQRVAKPRIYVGCGNWGHASWVGTIYPLKTPAARFRELYPKYFQAMELNATHYTIYGPDVIGKWAEPARGRDFRYCAKFPQSISHYSSFSGVDGQTDAFIRGIMAFEDNLGPAFLQVSDNFSPAKKKALYGYLAALPRDLDVFLEVRHPDWFVHADVLFPELQAWNKGLVITDAPGRRDAVHMYLTVPKMMLRFVSNRDHPTTFARIDEWVDRIAGWIINGLEEAYIFVHPGDEAVVPSLIYYWVETLNKRCGLELPLPYAKQQSLF